MLTYDDYIENTKFLVENNIIPENDIFYYDISPIVEVYDLFYDFAQVNLNESKDVIGDSSFFLFVNDTRVNAYGGRVEHSSVIGINSGSITLLFNTIVKDIDNYKKEDYSIFQAVLLWLYYHEKAHVLQKSNGNFNLNETYSDEFSIEKHLMEFDADMYGCTMVLGVIIQESANLRIPCSQLVSHTIAGLFHLFINFLRGDITEIYLYEKTHPHPLIRLLYLADQFDRLLKAHDIHEEEEVKDYLINDLKIVIKDEGVLQELQTKILNLDQAIADYFNDLFDRQEKYPNSAIKRDPHISTKDQN